ncbi:Arginase [Pleurotus pulmonarius]|nr:Arginase, catabolizes arginine to ornithine and urea [Pleurotus pulmonarius]KAF4578970.1 Arginase, catabolizes arginine to ornithine and urea [Pleurotus pulmonarius]
MASVSRFIKEPKTAAIVGCPFSGGQPKPGVDRGPIHLVEAGLVDQLKGLGWEVKFDGHHQFEEISAQYANDPDTGLVRDPPIGLLKNPRLVSSVTESVAQAVGSHCAKGELPVTLGGDHSLAMGTISGTLTTYPDAGVIWVDAHADINTVETTDTGNIHGMPLAFLLGLTACDTVPAAPNAPASSHATQPFSWIPSPPLLTPSRLVYIGLRDVDAGEKAILKKHGIKAFSMHEVDRYGIGKVVELAMEWLNKDYQGAHGQRPIHLSFDVDAMDPTVAPSTGTPVRGGLTFREGHYICEAVYETGSLVAFDLMEVNPSLADAAAVQQTVNVGCSLVRAALGETLL